MPGIVGPLLVVAALLVAAGVAKAIAPQTAAGALRAMHLPARPILVRALGIGEIALGIWVIAAGSTPAALAIAVAYLGFGLFVAVALVRDLPIGSCGCFGRDDTPPTWAHVVFNLAAVVTAVLAALDPVGAPTAWLPELGSAAIPFLVVTASALAFSYMLLAEMPKTMALIRKEPAAAGGGS